MPTVELDLKIEPEELLRWYSGKAHQVNAVALDGRRVLFPANVLRPFVGHHGIAGRFVIHFNDQGRFVKIDQKEVF